ncbi:Pyruvate/Phosphoenolpyruvate kinase-like domain-containing protein [Ilyonectria destructans]|nr:Pyruvate/Phosphoenolpyruvate kinase-like domain-containing protein [Ilyonectria destructans]
MSSGTPSCMADDGNTKLKASLLRAKAGGAPSMGQWLQYPGNHLASTVASLGPDVLVDCEHGVVDDSSMHIPRGTGGLFASLSWGMGMEYGKYSTSVNEKLVVIVQIETPLGVASCEQSAAVKGIDALYIGPNDLCASMGFLGRDHADMREVQEAGDKVLKAAKEAGKFAGYFCLSAEQATARVKKGWEFVNCRADIVAVMA